MSRWIPVWSYVPIDYHQEAGTLEHITQKGVFLNNTAGKAIRIRFQNRYGEEPMVFEHVALELRNRVTGRRSKRQRITCEGKEKIVLEPGSEKNSDELWQEVTAEDDLILWMYLKEKTVVRSACVTYAAYSWQGMQFSGDFLETEALGFTVKRELAPVLANDPYPNQFLVGLSSISILAPEETKLLALFGDSITHMSYFSDSLTELLYKRFPGGYTVINGGISGNRLQKSFPAVKLLPGGGHQFGIAGKDRFLRDLFTDAVPDLVFALIGVNDCSHSLVFGEESVPDAADIFAALEQVIRQAQEQGSRIYVSTIPPFGAFGAPWREAAEAKRQAYNELIRGGTQADGWIDLDLLMRDPEDIHRLQEGMHLGDGVHPNWAGGRKMAEAIFKKWLEQGGV